MRLVSSKRPESMRSSQIVKASPNAARVRGVGQMKSAITVPPASTTRSHIQPMRRACSTRSSWLKPRSRERLARTASALKTTALSSGASAFAKAVLPAPGRPMTRILRGVLCIEVRPMWPQYRAAIHGAQNLNDLRRGTQQLMYGQMCSVGAQLARVLALVERRRVHTVFMEDLAANPRQEYLNIMDFLELKDDGRLAFPIHNSSKKRRSALLAAAIDYCGVTKLRLGISRDFGLLKKVHTYNKVYYRPVLSAKMRDELRAFFRGDIELLADITDRDLRHWLG
jgi:hypothetical protein